MARDDKANVGHKHTTSDVRGGRFPEGMLPSTIIPSIEAAQAEAASKSKVVFSANAASGTDFSDGDIWYQRVAGIIIAQWEFVSGAWASRTLDGAVVANLDASKIRTGTLAAGQKITAGDPEGSRVELDSAGLRKYAADGATVQVDLTGEVAAFSGLVSGSQIVGGDLYTALTGPRLHLHPVIESGGLVSGARIDAYSDAVGETDPGGISVRGYHVEDPPGTVLDSSLVSIFGAYMDGVGLSGALISLLTGRTDDGINPPTAVSEVGIRANSVLLDTDDLTIPTRRLQGTVGSAVRPTIIHVVADSTARAALVALCVAADAAPTTAAPLLIWKSDEAAGSQLQYTVNGTTFVTIGGGGGTPLFADPGADRIVFWDDSAGAWAALTPGNGLHVDTTYLDVYASSTTQVGVVELATSAEAVTGTDTVRAVTPAGVKAAVYAVGASTGVSYSAGWADYGSPFSPVTWYKDKDGYIRLSGLVLRTGATITAGGSGTIFTLPVGARPAGYEPFVMNKDGGICAVTVQPDGVVDAGNPATWTSGSSYLTLGGVMFRAA